MPRCDRSRFWQTTALISASLLFCLAGVGAEAQDRYYNFGNNGGSPDPENGGTWTDNNDQYWTRPLGNGNWDTPNTDFDNNDDVYFYSPNGTLVEIEINGEVRPDEISVVGGRFEFNDDPSDPLDDGTPGSIRGSILTIDSASELFLDTDVEITDAAGNGFGVTSLGTLRVRTGRTLTADSGVLVAGGTLTVSGALDVGAGLVTVNDGSTLTVNANGMVDAVDSSVLISSGATLNLDGRVDGKVSVGVTGTVNFGANSEITDVLTLRGQGINVQTSVGGLQVMDGAEVTFGGSANSRIARLINNNAILTLGSGTYLGGLSNSGQLNLASDITLATTDAPSNANNFVDGTILASGGDRTLTVNGVFNSLGTLDGGTSGDTLTIAAATINVEDSTIFSGDVVLSGAINNNDDDLNLVHVPVLRGTFTNNTGMSATVSTVVDGNVQSFVNNGLLTIDVGSMTDLGSLTNTDGEIQVAADGSLGASTITHNSGSFVSAGTLTGSITANADATIQGLIQGSYAVAGGTTTIDGNLDVSPTTNDGRIEVNGGMLDFADGVIVTTAELVNNATLDLGLASQIDGNVITGGILTGQGRINGNLTLTGTGTNFSGTSLSVRDALINERQDHVLLSSIANVTYRDVINRGQMTIGEDVIARVQNDAGATLDIRGAVTGRLLSTGTTNIYENIDGRIRILGGTTRIYQNAAGGSITVGTAAGSELFVGDSGQLDMRLGSLTSTGTVRLWGGIVLNSAHTLTAPSLIISGDGISGDGSSAIRGTLAGDLDVAAAGAVTLDGATITGTTDNRGQIRGSDATGRSVRLQGGLVNRNQADFGSSTAVAVISGRLQNTDNATANIVGNVIATATQAGDVVNDGELNLTGNVAGQVTNRGDLDLIGNMAGLLNTADGDAVITGNIGTTGTLANFDAVNRGTLVLNGNIGNSLQNSATGTATINGNIGGNAINSGTLNLNGDVDYAIRNEIRTAVLNITGDSSAVNLVNRGTTNIEEGNRLDLTSGQLNNVQLATVNVLGTLGSGAAGGVNVQNNQGGQFNVRGTGTLEGNLTNSGVASVAGAVTGAVTNNASGTLNLTNAGAVTGALGNEGRLNVTGGNVSVSGGTTNSGGTIEVTGNLTSEVTNELDSDLLITGGTITGNVRNEADGRIVSSGTIVGNVANAGNFTLNLATLVDGDFTNASGGLVTQMVDNSHMTITGHFTNIGEVNSGAFGGLLISADTFENLGTVLGDVTIDANILNGNTITYDQDTQLLGDLSNGDNGTVNVWATVTGDGSNEIINHGQFEVANGGQLLNVSQIENFDNFSIASNSVVTAGSFVNAAGGNLTNNGRLAANVINREGATLVSSHEIIGDLRNEGNARLSGLIDGRLVNAGTATGVAVIAGNLTVTDGVRNSGQLRINGGTTLTSDQLIENAAGGTILAVGTINGNVNNAGNLQLRTGMQGRLTNSGELVSYGVIQGDVVNTGAASLTGQITGQLTNDGDSDVATDAIRISDNLRVGTVVNRGGALLVGVGKSLTVDGSLRNVGDGVLTIRGNVTVDEPLVNRSTRRMTMFAGSTLTGDLHNDARASLAGTIDGTLRNRGAADVGGRITGDCPPSAAMAQI